MKSPIHILHLEDDPNDAALVQSVLRTGSVACPKPYTPATLACKVREMLHATPMHTPA
jgi:hypothetical protein